MKKSTTISKQKPFHKIVRCVFITIFIYMYMIMPRIFWKPKKSPFMGVHYAHRGLFDNNNGVPENSMEAFRRAIDAGYGIELDVRLTKDKVPVIFHDYTLERMCGVSKKVEDLTYEQLCEFSLLETDEKIPTLKEFLELAAGQVPLIIELKFENFNLTLCPIAQALLDEYDGDYCIESFNPFALVWYRLNCNEVMRGQLSTNLRRDGNYTNPVYFLLTHLLTNVLTRPDFIAYNCRFKNEPGRIICRNIFKNTSAAWTVKSQKELDSIKDDFDLFIFESFVPEGE